MDINPFLTYSGGRKKAITRLNAVCPYYTMYPLLFPFRILEKCAVSDQWVLDPFCGRGTTNFAARLAGLPSVGVDSSPIAVAIAQAKLATATPSQVVRSCREILKQWRTPVDVPTGEFWKHAYDKETIIDLCKLREALLDDCRSESRIALRAIILGSLHGPITKRTPSYFSNQCPRTFAPKPAYATRFWKTRGLKPAPVDVLDLIERKATYYFSEPPKQVNGFVKNADSTNDKTFSFDQKFSWVITSPPYYGMRTYVQDQWLRSWFLGGPQKVFYRDSFGLTHESPEVFVNQLTSVWQNVGKACVPDARLVCRFGGINDRRQDPLDLIKRSLANTGWKLVTVRDAGTALNGKRQAAQFGDRIKSIPRKEYDIYARLKS